MRIGTKSILFGVHQFIWHPVTVYIAWRNKGMLWLMQTLSEEVNTQYKSKVKQ